MGRHSVLDIIRYAIKIMEELFNKDGEFIENAMSPEDVEQKLTEEREKIEQEKEKEFAESLEDAQRINAEELEAKEQERKELEEELMKERDKEKNFGALRGKTKEKEEQITKLTESIINLEKAMGEMAAKTSDSKIDGAVKEIAGDDKELADKTKYHYKRFEGEPKDEEEFKQRIADAFMLASGGNPSNAFTGDVISSVGGGGVPKENASQKKFENPEVAKDVAKSLGITEQEMAKHKLI